MPILRIMTYNILYGGVGREQLIRDVVTAIHPHIAIFTEVTDVGSLSSIADVVGRYRAGDGDSAGGEHPVIVSQWPILRVARHGPPWAPRKWVTATIRPFDGPQVAVHGVHLLPQLLWPFELLRTYEVGHLLKRLMADTDAAQLVAGDFNALNTGDTHRLGRAPWWVRTQWMLQAGMMPRWALRKLTKAGYTDCYRACNSRAHGFTVPAWDPQVRIDYLFASRSLRAALRSSDTNEPAGNRAAPRRSLAELLGRTTVKSLNGQASDHLPVWADFDWPDHAAG